MHRPFLNANVTYELGIPLTPYTPPDGHEIEVSPEKSSGNFEAVLLVLCKEIIQRKYKHNRGGPNNS